MTASPRSPYNAISAASFPLGELGERKEAEVGGEAAGLEIDEERGEMPEMADLCLRSSGTRRER